MAYVTIRELSMARAKIAKPAKTGGKLVISDLPHARFSLSAAISPRYSHNTMTLIYISTGIHRLESATLCSLLVVGTSRTRARSDECAPRWAHYYYIAPLFVPSHFPTLASTSICLCCYKSSGAVWTTWFLGGQPEFLQSLLIKRTRSLHRITGKIYK